MSAARPRIHPALALVLASGLLLRLAVMFVRPAPVLTSPDEARFALVAPPFDSLFDDYWMPSGYHAFLAGLRFLWSDVAFTLAVQHALGLLAAGLVWATLRRLGVGPWLSAVPAGYLAIGGDMLYLEHLLHAEVLNFVLVVVGIYLTVRAFGAGTPRSTLAWGAAAGAAFAASALMRSPTVPLAFLIAAVVAVTLPVAVRPRVRLAGALAGSAAVVFGVYVAVASLAGGYTGLNDMGGRSLYGRVAPFADCTRFDPPAEARALCEERPPEQRPGPQWYSWTGTKPPAVAVVGPGPERDHVLRTFAVRAILAQPVDYADAVAKDLARYATPEFGRTPSFSGQPIDGWSFGHRDPNFEVGVGRALDRRYSGVDRADRGGQALLEWWQETFRLTGIAFVAVVLLALAAPFFQRGVGRTASLVVLAATALLFVVPVAVFTYDTRYAMHPTALALMAATLAVAGLLARRQPTASATAAAKASTSSGDVSNEHIQRTSPVRSSHV